MKETRLGFIKEIALVGSTLPSVIHETSLMCGVTWRMIPTLLVLELTFRFASAETIQLSTKSGRVTGQLSVTTGNRVTSRFLGVPYAQPPVGELRFQQPLPHPGWAITMEPLIATNLPPPCPGSTSGRGATEDCLFLSIFVPRDLQKVEHINTLSLPVLLHLVADDFQRQPPFSPEAAEALGQFGDIIVVHVQYRVGVLGYLSLGNSSARGNAGLWDQRLAMQWIWDNIREFGGDPGRVSLLGEGAGGGAYVGLHLLSPASRGLFRRAILHTGSLASPGVVIDEGGAAAVAWAVAASVSCGKKTQEETAGCLRRLSMARLLNAATDVGRHWLPTIDGAFLPRSPYELLREARLNPVDVVLGSGANDGVDALAARLPKMYPVTPREFVEATEQVLESYFGIGVRQEVKEAVLMEYGGCLETPIVAKETLRNLVNDMVVSAPVVHSADAVTDSHRQAWVYVLSRPGPGPLTVPAIPPDLPANQPPYTTEVDPDDPRAAQLYLLTAWINFIRTGDPNPFTSAGIYWRPYTRQMALYLDLAPGMGRHSLRADIHNRRTAFWNHYFPAILRQPHHRSCDVTAAVFAEKEEAIREKQSRTVVTVWALVVVCAVLAALLLVLAARFLLPDRMRCCQRSQRTSGRRREITEAETRKLQPLPYTDEASVPM